MDMFDESLCQKAISVQENQVFLLERKRVIPQHAAEEKKLSISEGCQAL